MSKILRTFVGACTLAILVGMAQGCGGGDLKQGIPDDVDMSQAYPPAADVGAFSQREMTKNVRDPNAPKAAVPGQ
jgi:hypothetical protein